MNYRSPQEYGKLLVKRLIALPGDKVVWPNFTDLSHPLKLINHLTLAPCDILTR
jgi:signal peptidase I